MALCTEVLGSIPVGREFTFEPRNLPRSAYLVKGEGNGHSIGSTHCNVSASNVRIYV